MRVSIVLLLVLAAVFTAPFLAAQSRTSKPLDIYVIDVEGGNATLFVSPSGESLLIDTGNAGAAAARDAGRIMAAVKDAGLQQIDHLITTHWHEHLRSNNEPGTLRHSSVYAIHNWRNTHLRLSTVDLPAFRAGPRVSDDIYVQ